MTRTRKKFSTVVSSSMAAATCEKENRVSVICNSANLWDANRGRCFIATGYALSEDGLWRSHSWVVQPMPRTLRVWETTVKRVAYFGVVLTEEECDRFYRDNG